ncbi:MAG: tyrosine-type recombinase/integrase [Chloroflexota bacterium]
MPNDEHQLTPLPNNLPEFESVVAFALTTVAPASAETYQRTYDLWTDYCMNHRQHPLDLRPLPVRDFLISQPVTRRTRQRHLAALRKLARVLALDPARPAFRSIYEALRLLNVPEDGVSGQERETRALNADQVQAALAVWSGERLLHWRNRALIALLFFTGLRRSEVVTLRWTDIDLEAGVIHLRRGKGGQPRDVSIVRGTADSAVAALKAYRRAQAAASKTDRQYVFCAITRWDTLRQDAPLHVRAVNQIVDQTAASAGETFTPHDARRTLGTDLLAHNHPTADVQAQLGHAHASTTIQSYAKPADARKRRKSFKTSY